MEEITNGQVPAPVESQETTQQVEPSNDEYVPVEYLKKASGEAKEYRHKLRDQKARAAELEAELHSIKQRQLQEQGKYKEMYDQQLAETHKFQKEYENLQKKVVLERVSSSFKLAAQNAGCVDPDSAWKLIDRDALDINDDLSVEGGSLVAAIEKAKQKMPYMFQKAAPVIADTTPGTVQSAPAKPVSQMSADEFREYMKNNEDIFKNGLDKLGL